jgi:hypothetical protein
VTQNPVRQGLLLPTFLAGRGPIAWSLGQGQARQEVGVA